MNDRVVVIVQARTGSSRLPGKALKPLAGKEMILHVMARAAAMGYSTWMATSLRETDDALAHLVIRNNYPVFRGDERDVLGRMYDTACAAQAEVVVRVTGDCPLFAPDVGERVLDLWRRESLSRPRLIATNDTSTSGWPDGLDVEVFDIGTLAKSDAYTRVPDGSTDRRDEDRLWRDREHVTLYMRREWDHVILPADVDWRKIKLSVDEQRDFDRVNAVMGHLQNGDMSWAATREAYTRWQEKE